MNAPTTSPHWPKLPEPLRTFFANFPLYTYPAILPTVDSNPAAPTIWALPSADNDLLSANVNCLCWQAYLALRGIKNARVRFDVSESGAVGNRLPNLHIPAAKGDSMGQILPVHEITSWVNTELGVNDELEGYISAVAKDESKAWISLLQGNIHAALTLANPQETTLASLFLPPSGKDRSLDASLSTPAAPLFGFSTLLYTKQTRVPKATIDLQYQEAISSLSDRLGNDQWFLGSSAPTFLDALAFAYLHRLLLSPQDASFEVSRRTNLVTWEKRVLSLVKAVFEPAT